MSQLSRLVLGFVVVLGAVTLYHGKSNLKWFEDRPRAVLTVAHLPVTCHLTCPVASWVTNHSETGTIIKSKKYNDFASIVTDIDAGQLDATFLLAPFAMRLARQGKTPVKIVHLGHRDGTAMVVLKDSPFQNFGDLRGKRVAIPHRYSNQKILVYKLMEQFGITKDEITLLDYPPPDMPNGLKTGSFEAFIVGEPHPSKTEVDGYGRVLYLTKDIWPNFISCVCVVTQKMIDTRPDLVQELVSGITASGEWIDTMDERLADGIVLEKDATEEQKQDEENWIVIPEGFGHTSRMQAAQIAASKKYYGQNPKYLQHALSNPPDRVRYTNLELAEDDFKEILKYAQKLGYFELRPVTEADPFNFLDFCDPRFERGKHEPIRLHDVPK